MNHWTQEESELLISLAKKYNNKWTEVCKHLKNRTPTAWSVRFCIMNSESKAKTGKWSSEEDMNLYNWIFKPLEDRIGMNISDFGGRRKGDVFKRVDYFKSTLFNCLFPGMEYKTVKNEESKNTRVRKSGIKRERKSIAKQENYEDEDEEDIYNGLMKWKTEMREEENKINTQNNK